MDSLLSKNSKLTITLKSRYVTLVSPHEASALTNAIQKLEDTPVSYNILLSDSSLQNSHRRSSITLVFATPLYSLPYLLSRNRSRWI